MSADVITFPGREATCEVTSQGGDYTVQVKVTGSGPYPMKGGQGDYQPRTVLLVWTTTDGVAWTFRHAVAAGPQIEKRTGEPGPFSTSQTLYLGDPNYAGGEPVWLAAIVHRFAPGKAPA
jgi:hypothetical protein